MTDPDPMTQLKALTREHMRLIWQIAQMGGELHTEDDRRTFQAMREHPEYAHLWGRLDRLSDAEITVDGTNPILHITTHVVIENQIASGDPPETGQAVAELERRGFSHHEAVHRVGMALMEEIWHMLREERVFDPAHYTDLIAKILRSSAKPATAARLRQRTRPKRRR